MSGLDDAALRLEKIQNRFEDHGIDIGSRRSGLELTAENAEEVLNRLDAGAQAYLDLEDPEKSPEEQATAARSGLRTAFSLRDIRNAIRGRTNA